MTDASNTYMNRNPGVENQIVTNEVGGVPNTNLTVTPVGTPIPESNPNIPPKSPTVQATQNDGDAVSVRPMGPTAPEEKVEKVKQGLQHLLSIVGQ